MKQTEQVRRKNVKRGKRKRTLSSKEGKNVKAKLEDQVPAKAAASADLPAPPPPSVQCDEVESNSSGSSSKEEKGQPSDTNRSETIFSNTLLNNVLNMKKKEFFQSPEVLLFLQSRIKSS